MRSLRKTLKYLLPYGLVEVARNRRLLADWGYHLRPRDWWRSDWVLHEAETTGLDLFPPGGWRGLRTVVDVGANVGEWSAMLQDLISPAKLMMIEPAPEAFARLLERFGHNKNIELHNVALGATNGVTNFHVTRDSTGASVLPPRDSMSELIGSNWTVETKIEVPLRTLDSLLKTEAEISLLKIDVQGFEKSVLAGAGRSLEKTNFLLIELNYMQQYEGGAWFGEIHEILTQEHPFVLVDASKPLRLNGRASMSDGLYVNLQRMPDFAPREFV